MKKRNIILIAGISLTMNACYYDVQEELHPSSSLQICDTTNITYAGKVASILSANCNSCHSQSVASGNIRLDNFAGVKIVADNGRLVGAIEHTPGFVKMPQNLAQLSECDRLTIKKWIQNGSSNN